MTRGSPPLPTAETLVAALLPWFRVHARDLPWRRTRDPYGIWISEIMLQQTQVKTVIPYWDRWMQSLPGVTALASALEQRVLKLWEGLGYYSRARNLQRAAQQLVDTHEGRLPTTVDGLLDLPGIGRYTAGAIASIAFDQPAPILDGNVIRVLTRLYALRGDPKSTRVNARLWRLAEDLVTFAAAVPREHFSMRFAAGPCSALNQSLMELGATVCTPRDPDCARCPVSGMCRARSMNRATDFPASPERAAVTAQRKIVAVVERSGRYLLRQRPAFGINGGFWEFPERDLTERDSAPAAASVWLKRPVTDLQPLSPVRHSITRYRIHLEVFQTCIPRGKLPFESEGRWFSTAELTELALTAAHRRIARQLAG